MYILGAHISIAKGFAHAAKTTVGMGGNTFQFFSRNPRGSSVKAFQDKDLREFQQIRREAGLGPILAHAPYTMNLAGTDPKVYEFALQVVAEDIRRMDEIGIEYFNLHPGSHVGAGAEQGIAKIIHGLNQAITGKESIMVLLETMSGKGSEVGYRFEELRQIIDGMEHPERLGVCMDLCHVFAAGYDIVGNIGRVLEEFDQIIGLERLKTIHLNDSMMAFDSRKDRHATIGQGEIGLEAILRVMRHPAIKRLPFYLETPLEVEGHQEEIAMLRQLLDGEEPCAKA